MEPENSGFPSCAIKECGFPVDIVIKPKDGRLLGTHTKNLELFNTSFPSLDVVAHRIEDIVPFEENADVVEMFLRFCHNYPCSPKDIVSLGVDSAISFHRAVHKYQNRHALRVCDAALDDLCLEHDEDAIIVKILLYRIMYTLIHGPLVGLDDLIRRALTLSVEPPDTALETLLTYGKGFEGGILATYAIYAEKWRTCYERYQRVVRQELGTNPATDSLERKALRKHLEMSPHHIPTLDDMFHVRSILDVGNT
ncbi:hypothetical protein AAF712_008130 [Marasmius tenuissimus]|uniref:BTB domain-containing protein n=1 Tax=Marasmius tenuissimus TaxID=585030 RepID=A0ABR2ZT73_9AGAR